MALAATCVFEVRTTGADTNGGGFNSAAAGSDFSQQDAAQKSGTDLAIHAADDTKVQPVAAGVAAADIGNIIQISAGAGFTVGFYEITAQDGTYWTLDRAAGTIGSTGGTYGMGGALASPAMAAGAMATGNDMYVKAGTYLITTTSSNVSGGTITLPASASNANQTRMIGYESARGDGGTKPLLQASGAISSFTIIATTTGNRLENIEIDCASKTTSRCVTVGGNSIAYRVKALNATNNGFGGTSSAFCFFCEATGCGPSAAGFLSVHCYDCVAYDNVSIGFQSSLSGINFVRCLSINGDNQGFLHNALTGQCINCTAYGNGAEGFRGNVGQVQQSFINCIAVNNGTYGFSASLDHDGCFLYNCAGFNNTSGNINTTISSDQQIGFITLTADPFIDAAGNNFALNNTGGGGASCRAAGIPGATSSNQFPGISTLNYQDVGAAQHNEPTIFNVME